MPKFTLGPWRVEAVSDAVRVVVGAGRKKIILARLSPKQIDEAETHANARLMAAAPEMYEALKLLQEFGFIRKFPQDEKAWSLLHAALAKAEGE